MQKEGVFLAKIPFFSLVARAPDSTFPHAIRLVAARQVFLEDSLNDALALADDLGLVAEIAETDDDFPVILRVSVIIRVNDGNRVPLRDAFPDAQARTDIEFQHFIRLHPRLDSRMDDGRSLRLDSDIDRRREIIPCSIFRRPVRENDTLVLETFRDGKASWESIVVVSCECRVVAH